MWTAFPENFPGENKPMCKDYGVIHKEIEQNTNKCYIWYDEEGWLQVISVVSTFCVVLCCLKVLD